MMNNSNQNRILVWREINIDTNIIMYIGSDDHNNKDNNDDSNNSNANDGHGK